MIIKVSSYVELIGKVDPSCLQCVADELSNQFYFILRKRKIKTTNLMIENVEYNFCDAGVDDVRLLSKEEANESLRKKK
jgi:hypothetical protein